MLADRVLHREDQDRTSATRTREASITRERGDSIVTMPRGDCADHAGTNRGRSHPSERAE